MLSRLLSALTLTAALSACGNEEPPTDTSAPSAERVRISAVEAAPGNTTLRFASTARSGNRGVLAFQVSGQLSQRVAIGTVFEAGTVLAELRNPRLAPARDAARNRLEQIRADRAQAERDLQRVSNLRQQQAATEEELEKTRAGLQTLRAAETAAQAQLAEAEQLLAETQIRATYSGTVSQTLAKEGEFVNPGQPILSISGDTPLLEVEITLPEALALQRRVGETMTVRFPMLNAAREAQVIEVANAAPGPGRLFPLVLSFAAEGLRAGISAEVEVPSATRGEMTVPLRAVVDPGSGQPSVFALEGNKVRRVAVELGDLIGERIVVSGDLNIQDQVVVAGLARLIDGQRVSLLGAEAKP
nr:efflux RND transporter periplasmic adaptor subunit [Oceanococcus sp. HetDA_MAG_MS8]